ncbi:ATP-binding protein [Pseudobutyrivibrio xylanivorans]|uniref:ATP-binding protein n=1 Tax=Pseudobutyrivibrio xylanivorans TaxID=185007 RepID=A0A5P6VTN2_PSEXY|nr:AAA family ATPase [Pseudobutyrivibrio xylanivorans]QFJ55996.1 ATP-binding protein [Pseudobutyrivibrio xylanivorans]
MIKRKIYSKILDWKNSTNGTKALLIEGARRIGKSTVAEEIGKNEYKSYILIDFNKASKKIFNLFDNLNELDVFFQTISLEYNTRLYNRESLIIFDEIQKYPKAREAIKYLVADGRYDYIETGSLISIKENVEGITIPSEERKLKMYPVDFEEFMVYMGEELLIEYIRDCYNKREPLDQSQHNKAMHLFKEYMLVGGMPQSVVAFKKNARDFYAADVEKRDILNLYRDDIRKAARKYNSRVSAIFENIPGYLSTHEKKIVLSEIEPGATFDRYDEPLFWLDDSMICNLCYKCNDPNVGLALNKNESAVKCYMGDTGLLVSLAFAENEITEEKVFANIMDGKLSLNEGMLYENVIAQIIASKGKKLYFYTRYSEEKHRNDIEIDFLISNDSKTNYKVNPIEVKSSKNYSALSIGKFVDIFKRKVDNPMIVHPKNLVEVDGILRIPSYMFALCDV